MERNQISEPGLRQIPAIHGTKVKYLPAILYKGLERSNSAVFVIPDRPASPEELIFTVQVAIYHAISLGTQKEVLGSGKNFTNYFRDNPGEIPGLIALNAARLLGAGTESETQQSRYFCNSNQDLATFPYVKVGPNPIPREEIYAHRALKNSAVASAENELQAEGIYLEKEKQRTRFFIKRVMEQIREFESDNLVSQIYMERFCHKLANSLIGTMEG